MAWYQAISGKSALRTMATLVGATVFLLSACQNQGRVPVPAPTKVNQPTTPVTLQPEFAFIFGWRFCDAAYTLNTFDNRLTLEANMSPPVTTTIDFVLSPLEQGTIFQKMSDIGLFSYPDEFSIQLPPNETRLYGIPATYSFEVRSGNQTKVVRWNDEFSEDPDMPWKDEDSQPSKTQAAKLRELIDLTEQIVEAHPEFQKLPGPGGCA